MKLAIETSFEPFEMSLVHCGRKAEKKNKIIRRLLSFLWIIGSLSVIIFRCWNFRNEYPKTHGDFMICIRYARITISVRPQPPREIYMKIWNVNKTRSLYGDLVQQHFYIKVCLFWLLLDYETTRQNCHIAVRIGYGLWIMAGKIEPLRGDISSGIASGFTAPDPRVPWALAATLYSKNYSIYQTISRLFKHNWPLRILIMTFWPELLIWFLFITILFYSFYFTDS